MTYARNSAFAIYLLLFSRIAPQMHPQLGKREVVFFAAPAVSFMGASKAKRAPFGARFV
jgi:hypothetical protein